MMEKQTRTYAGYLKLFIKNNNITVETKAVRPGQFAEQRVVNVFAGTEFITDIVASVCNKKQLEDGSIFYPTFYDDEKIERDIKRIVQFQ